MPYLFRDHDHAQQVLEGTIGTELLNSFQPESRLKGLAYTYSGGFRLMPFKTSVTSLADLAGQSVRSGMSPMAQDTMRALGFEPIKTEIDEVNTVIGSDAVVGAEHVAQRLLPDQCDDWIDTIVDTQHSLFLTSIVVNTDWWASLDARTQDIFLSCALEAARNERELSIRDGEQSLRKLEEKGVKIVSLDEQELTQLRSKTHEVYDKYQDFFAPGLIDAIKYH